MDKFSFPITPPVILVIVAVLVASLAASLAMSSVALALPDHCSSASSPVFDNKTGRVIRCIPQSRSTTLRRIKNRNALRLRQKKNDQRALRKLLEVNQRQIRNQQTTHINQLRSSQRQLSQRRRRLEERQVLERIQPTITKKQKQRILELNMSRPASKDQLNLQQKQEQDQRRAGMVQTQKALERQQKLSRGQKFLLKSIIDKQQAR